MGASSDNEAQPEPDVANQHDQADEEDQEDGLVVGSSAGLLYLDEGRVVHQPVVDVCLAGPEAGDGGLRGELLALPGPVDLGPLAAAVQLVVEDVVAREGVLRPGQVELGDQSQPDLHLPPPVPVVVGGHHV